MSDYTDDEPEPEEPELEVSELEQLEALLEAARTPARRQMLAKRIAEAKRS